LLLWECIYGVVAQKRSLYICLSHSSVCTWYKIVMCISSRTGFRNVVQSLPADNNHLKTGNDHCFSYVS
jgi:hypothetical protein